MQKAPANTTRGRPNGEMTDGEWRFTNALVQLLTLKPGSIDWFYDTEPRRDAMNTWNVTWGDADIPWDEFYYLATMAQSVATRRITPNAPNRMRCIVKDLVNMHGLPRRERERKRRRDHTRRLKKRQAAAAKSPPTQRAPAPTPDTSAASSPHHDDGEPGRVAEIEEV